MKRKISNLTLATILCLTSFLPAQITVISPASEEIIRSADDYPALSFQDHCDMDNRLDLGWWLYVDDQPLSYLSNITFSNGIFSADTTGSDPNISILDTGVPGTCFLGKIGTNYPIDANKYKLLMMRMKLDTSSAGQIIWSKNTIFSGVSISNAFYTYSGWNIYCIDIAALGAALGESWSGYVDSLRLDPTIISNDHIEIDWIRLVEVDSGLYKNIQWSGASGPVDIFLDDDTNYLNGNLGRIASNETGNSTSFYAGGLPYGSYYIGIRASGTQGALAYSPGYYRVNDIPVLKFVSPSEEGSCDDFATTQLNDAWDMDSTNDIDYTRHLTYMGIETVNAEDEAGNALGTISVLKGISEAAGQGGAGNPELYTLWWTERGAAYHIDSDRYRILVLEMGLPGNRDLVGGSQARIIWKNVGESVENVSEDIVLQSKDGTLVMNKIIADMKALPNESDPGGSPSLTGWKGMIDNFRVDPHEFSDSKDFYIRTVKLAALEKTASSYLIEWNYSDNYSTSSSLFLYYDTDRTGFDGTQLASGINPDAGSYSWDVSGVPDGTYYIYAVFTDGMNTNRCYARWPIVVEHNYIEKPKVSLSRENLNFGLLNDGVTITSPQEVVVSIIGQGSVNWSVESNKDYILVDPANGTGNGKFTVSIDPRQYWVGEYDGLITLTSNDISNSPQFVYISMRVYSAAGGSQPPIGHWDTPLDGTTQVRGQIPVTGWALDDIEVDRVEIWRRAEPEDPPEAINPEGLVPVGTALFVEGARPNLETDFPYNLYPYNYKGGWGYMLLTYGLARRGNGEYVLHAFVWDVEGKKTALGTKTITCDNVNAVKPFGTIDTPAPGMVFPHSFYGNINFGWVLTPQPKYIPFDGSSIYVYIDGVLKGNLAEYGNYSASVAEMFPGYVNTNNSYGHYFIDLASYENGVHTIQWTAYDSEGVGEGIGSRYFSIENTGMGQAGLVATGSGKVIDGRKKRSEPYQSLSDLSLVSDSYTQSVRVRQGYMIESDLREVFPNDRGVVNIKMQEVNRVEIHLSDFVDQDSGGSRYCGYLVVGDQLRPLPVGSTLDEKKGIFYWQPGAGFIGEYDFIFIKAIRYGTKKTVKIKINILPKF